MLNLVFYVLMVAPTASDMDVENYAIPLGVYEEQEECVDAMMWLDEHEMGLPRHIFCMPVGLEGEPA